MEQDPFAQYAVTPKADPFAAYAVQSKPEPKSDPFAAFAVEKPEVSSPAAEPEKSFWAKAIDAVFTPLTTLPSKVAPVLEVATRSPLMGETEIGLRKALAGMSGDFASQMTSPGDLALTAATGGANALRRAGLTAGAKAVRGAEAALGAGLTARGAERIVTGDSPVTGVLEMAGGLATAIPGVGAVVRAGRQADAAVPAVKEVSEVVTPPPARPRLVAVSERLLPNEGQPYRKIEQQADLSGKPIPEQQPLDKARIEGEKKFLETQPEPFREGLSRILEESSVQHFEAQRRGRQPLARTNEIAKWVQVERKEALPKGTALNAEELTAYKNAIATNMDRIAELSDTIRKGGDSSENQAALTKAAVQTVTMLSNAMGARAETGRALNALKGMAQVLRTNDLNAYEQMIKVAKQYGLDPKKLATEFAELGNDPIKQMKYLRGLHKAGAMDWMKGVFFSNILSGPRTHIRNIVGNTTNAVFRSMSQGAAYGVDVAKHVASGGKHERTIFAGEVAERAKGAFAGLYHGIQDAKFALKNGFTQGDLGTFDVARKELQGGGANPLNWTGRLLEAEDQFFYAINYNSELFARLYAHGRKLGLKGQELTDKIADWKLAPPPEVHAAANKEAIKAVFKEEGGRITEKILAAKASGGAWKALDFVVPFVRTPGNIIRQGLEATPLGLLTQQSQMALKAGGREQVEALGRAATGSLALAGLAWWAGLDNISGSGPIRSSERAALTENGWKPNAVRLETDALGLTDKPVWVEFSYFTQPLSTALFALANAKDTFDGSSPKDWATKSAMSVAEAASAIKDQSFLSGASDLNDALSDPKRYLVQFLEKHVQSWVPASGLMRNVTQMRDSVVREPQGPLDSMKAIVPFLSETVAPKIGRLGQEVERQGGPVVRGISPANVGMESQDPVVQELSRLKIKSLGLPPKTLDATADFPAITLTIDERKQVGRATRQALEDLFSAPGFKTLPEAEARLDVAREVQRARSQAYEEIRRTRQDLSRY